LPPTVVRENPGGDANCVHHYYATAFFLTEPSRGNKQKNDEDTPKNDKESRKKRRTLDKS
jgi:hypothetical protein